MARLDSSSGYTLDLTPVSYQYPTGDNKWDLNWLVMEMVAEHGDCRWRGSAPAFLAWELSGLCDWLDAAASGVRDRTNFSGIEPCLQFELTFEGAPQLRVEFAQEFDPEHRVDGVVWTLPLELQRLKEFATQLRRETAGFPLRSVNA